MIFAAARADPRLAEARSRSSASKNRPIFFSAVVRASPAAAPEKLKQDKLFTDMSNAAHEQVWCAPPTPRAMSSGARRFM
jgi:hypothetical protein